MIERNENKNTVDLDYKAEYKKLREKHDCEINEIHRKYEEELRTKDKTWRGITNEQQEEINWLKSIIKGILHIS